MDAIPWAGGPGGALNQLGEMKMGSSQGHRDAWDQPTASSVFSSSQGDWAGAGIPVGEGGSFVIMHTNKRHRSELSNREQPAEHKTASRQAPHGPAAAGRARESTRTVWTRQRNRTLCTCPLPFTDFRPGFFFLKKRGSEKVVFERRFPECFYFIF